MSIVCIGSGNMGFALMKCVFDTAPGMNIFFTDADIKKAVAAADALKSEVIKSNAEAAKKGEYIFLAVKPQVLEIVLAEISGVLRNRLNDGSPPALVSMAAGWPIEKIQRAAGAKLPVIRIMPNMPALIGKGMIALAASNEVNEEKISKLENILGKAGIIDRIDEKHMDGVTGLSGSGPAFACIFIEALADGGVRAGLPRDKALRYAAQTVLGAAAMVQETGKHPGELKDMAASAGGTTIAGIAALEEKGFRSAVIKAVEAAWLRSVELG